MDPTMAGPWAAEVASQGDTIQMLIGTATALAVPVVASVLNTFVSSKHKSTTGKIVKGLIKFFALAVGQAKTDPHAQK